MEGQKGMPVWGWDQNPKGVKVVASGNPTVPHRRPAITSFKATVSENPVVSFPTLFH